MARSHGKILSSIWRDPSWLALSKDAKSLYVLLLSQPNLTLVGSLDLAIGRWSTYSPDDSREAMQAALDELRGARFVIVDDTTDELLVRSFTAHDIDPNRVNVNLARGLWGSWGAVASPVLRSIAVHEMPDAVWDKLEPHAPPDAVETRRSARLEPAERAPVATGEGAPGCPSLPPPSSLLSPAAHREPAEQQPELSTDAQDQLILHASRIAAQERASGRAVGEGWIVNATKGIAADNRQTLLAHLTANPDATVADLVEIIEPINTTPQNPTTQTGAVVDDDGNVFLPGTGWCKRVAS